MISGHDYDYPLEYGFRGRSKSGHALNIVKGMKDDHRLCRY